MALQPRPPVITIMGHVDHGKTSLLDYIRKSRVAAREAGGITQHIGAYSIQHQGKALTFIDTPGHAAFNKMRERGSQITDFVVLVVAANDGVKPQTIESIRHIKAAQVPVVVAINKVDLPDVYPDMVKAQLAEHDILVTGFGGSVDVVELSAKTGDGVDELLNTLGTLAELSELSADSQAPLEATVIESQLDQRRGPVASVIVQAGTLEPRQDIVIDGVESRVRALSNEQGEQLKEVLPGFPAEIIGLKVVPAVGAEVRALGADYPEASADAGEGADGAVEAAEAAETVSTEAIDAQEADFDPFADIDFEAAFEEKAKLKLILRADTEGTLEAIKQNLDDEGVELLDSGVGTVTDSDVELAKTSGAAIISFHVKNDKRVLAQAKTAGVRVKEYDIIYKLIEDLQQQILRLMEPSIDEVVLGEAEILQIFEMRGSRIAGVRVKTGELKKNDLFHLKREEQIIANPVVKSMQHGKEEIESVKAKSEAGFTFKNKKLDFQVGDLIVAYKKED